MRVVDHIIDAGGIVDPHSVSLRALNDHVGEYVSRSTRARIEVDLGQENSVLSLTPDLDIVEDIFFGITNEHSHRAKDLFRFGAAHVGAFPGDDDVAHQVVLEANVGGHARRAVVVKEQILEDAVFCFVACNAVEVVVDRREVAHGHAPATQFADQPTGAGAVNDDPLYDDITDPAR